MRKLSKKEWIAVAVGVILVGYTLFGADAINLFRKSAMNGDSLANVSGVLSDRVVINDIVIGNGTEVRSGDLVTVHYSLSLSDGTAIQNSKDFGVPFQFTLGVGEVIQGWEQGFVGMKVGGVRTIVIPPELGYGANQAGPIPPNSTLVFTVELLDVSSSEQIDLPIDFAD
ncbi:MAG: FKBP-type peptidyl-prolyl cis-trans isomerase [Candidatus Zambryskibacteria bacterium]|nr:FKBP-type peptidyl-prolyl cis-trans isomerase [Candidatus Zambryskibacteria bacterium]